MDASVRWMAFAGALGFCVAYALWGPSGVPAALALMPAKASAKSSIDPSALRYDPAILDFGDIRVGDVKAQAVKISNPTAQPITIKDIRGSCGCISLDLKEKVVPANGTVDLTVHYAGLAGSIRKEFGVTATTTEHPDARASLPIHAHTVSIFTLDPGLLFFEVNPGDTEKVLTTKLTRTDGKPFLIRGADVRNSHFKLTWKPLPDLNNTAYELTCTLDARQVAASVETIAIVTDHPTNPVVELKASVRGTSSVTALLPVMVAQWSPDAKSLTFNTPIQRNTPGTLEILSIKDGRGKAIKTSLVRKSATVIQVDITMTDVSEFEHKLRDGEFIIETNVLPEPLRLPYTVPPPPPFR